MDKTYFVYFIQMKDSLGSVKIGVSGDVKKRLGTLQTSSPEKLFVLGVESFETEKEAYEIEKFFHKSFAHNRLNGEWFSVGCYMLEAIARWTEPYGKRTSVVEFPVGWGKGGLNIPQPEEVRDWAKKFYKSRRVPFNPRTKFYLKSGADK